MKAGAGPGDRELRPETRVTGWDYAVVIGVAIASIVLERSIGQKWPPSPEIMVEAAIAVLALIGPFRLRSIRTVSLFRCRVFRNIILRPRFFLQFHWGLVFTTMVFLPSLSGRSLRVDAHSGRGLVISPRGIGYRWRR